MAACSLSFVSITLLMEYRMVLRWVYKEDWIALMDVVPSTFSMMTGYVVIMLMANTISMMTISPAKICGGYINPMISAKIGMKMESKR